MNLGSNVKFFLELQAQLKINHWQTKMTSRHQAFGDAYNKFSDLSDKFIEIAMYKYDRFKLKDEDKSLEIHNLNDLVLKDMIDKSVNALIEIGETLGKKDTDLMNIKDELIGILNQMGYLLSMEC